MKKNKVTEDKQNKNIQAISNLKLDSSNINQTATTGIFDTTVKDINQNANFSNNKFINK